MLTVIIHAQSLGTTFSFIITRPVAYGIHIPPISLPLGMRQRITIHLTGRSLKYFCFVTLRQSQHIKRADNKAFKIWKARVVETDGAYAPGCICKVGKNTMVVQTGEGGLELLEVQLAGKKRMDAGSFLRGYPVAEGSFLQQ